MKYETPYDRPSRKAAETATAEMGETEKGSGEEEMSVIVKGMDMPERCSECELYDVMAQDKKAVEFCRYNMKPLPDDEERASWCPLIPLPEKHGRLVDAREVLEKADKAPWFDGDVSELGLLLGSEVTTIFQAEGGGEDG